MSNPLPSRHYLNEYNYERLENLLLIEYNVEATPFRFGQFSGFIDECEVFSWL